jgi:alginate O-acetyltransferase complex protein AlgI
MNGMDLSLSLLDVKFVLLMAGLAVLRVFWPQKQYALLMAISSALLIGLGSPKTLLVIAGVTVLYLYPIHRLTRVTGTAPKGLSRTWLWLAIGGLVAALFLFKLDREFALPWLGGPGLRAEFLALVGFSYFIFRAISFLTIQSIIKIDERNPWTLLSYTLFPPTISSGPIQKFEDFRQQIASPTPLSIPLALNGVYRITRGYFRKAVLAFVLNESTTRLLSPKELTVFTSVIVVVLLYMYFYFDFAGYSDIAIGFGLLMGIRVPENFRNPFLTTTVSEFWRHWHITLVDWFRDHVFIPLGGMQSSRRKAAGLAFLTMVLCGMWHGLTISFIAWGIWHGAALFTEAIMGVKPVPPARRHGMTYWSKVAWTNARVAIAGILFLPDPSDTLKVLRGFGQW